MRASRTIIYCELLLSSAPNSAVGTDSETLVGTTLSTSEVVSVHQKMPCKNVGSCLFAYDKHKSMLVSVSSGFCSTYNSYPYHGDA